MTRLRSLSLAVSAFYLLLFLALVCLRFTHPYALEWEEGAMVDQVHRILAGLPLYGPPSVEFTAQLYTPLYFYASAAIGAVTGVEFQLLRALSVLGALASFALIGAFVRRETGSAAAALLGAGFFAACYQISGAWLDIARVDAFALPWMLGGAYVLRRVETMRAAVFAGLLFAIGYQAKQTALAVSLPMLVHLALIRPRLALGFGATLLVGIGGAHLLFDALTDGWYTIYTLSLAQGHDTFAPMVIAFWWMDLLKPAALACAVVVGCIVASVPRGAAPGSADWRARWSDASFWFFFLGACVGASWTGRMHSGGHVNVVLPAYAAMAMAWGVAIHRVGSGTWSLPFAGARSPVWIYVLCLAQLALLFYDPRPMVPTQAQREGGDRLMEYLASIDGEVFSEWHGHLPTRVGKQAFAHRSALKDIMRADNDAAKAILQRSIDDAIASRRFAVVLVDNPLFLEPYLKEPLSKHYRHTGRIWRDGTEVGPVIGWRYDPHAYLPK